MKIRILDRYLFIEAAQMWLAVTGVLLVVLLSSRFTATLAKAVAGDIPREFLFGVAAFNGLRFLVLLIPVSLMLAVMLALGRLYKDQEIAAMAGCGVGLRDFYRPFVALALALSLLTAVLAFEWGPWAARRMDGLLGEAAATVQYTPFESGQFKTAAGGRATTYADAVDDSGIASGVFAEIPDTGAGAPSLLVAARGHQSVDARSGERLLTLDNGARYEGLPGRADYGIVEFERLQLRLRPPAFAAGSGKRDRAATAALWAAGGREDLAELHWRLAAPLSVFLLALLAVPLAHLGPRQSRYAKLVWGILAYLVYSNLLGVGQTLLRQGVVPAALGLWWVHGLAALAVYLLVRLRMGGSTGRSLPSPA